MIPDERRRRTRRFEGQEALPALREAFSNRPEWRQFSPHQLSVLMFLYGSTRRSHLRSSISQRPYRLRSRTARALRERRG
jgi:hypothetical protein